jgi:hypothetical protein
MRCSMQYYFRYVKGMIERPNLAMTAGTAGHSALQANYMKKIGTGYDMPLPDLLDKYSDFHDNETSRLEPSDLQPDEDLGVSKDNGMNQLRHFHAKVAPKIRPALVEFEFNVDMSDPEYGEPLRISNGRIDLITTSEEIFDNKFLSRRSRKSQLEIDSSPQLDMYDLAYNLRFGRDARNVGIMAFIPPGKKADTPPEVQILTRDPRLNSKTGKAGRRARIIHKLHTVERAIKSGIFMPADDPKTCSWCGYREQCQYSLVRDDFTAMKLRALPATQELT